MFDFAVKIMYVYPFKIFSDLVDDSLTEEDLKSIAMEQMETAQETNETEKAGERLLLSEDCQRFTPILTPEGI